MIRYLTLLVLLFAAAPSLAGTPSCLKYEKPGTSVLGTLTRVRMETRTLEKHPRMVTVTRWMLETSQPFCVDGDQALGNITMRGASSIELIPTDQSGFVPFIGKQVRVTGSLLSTYIPHYHAYLVMRVSSVHEVLQHTPNNSSKRTR